MFAVGAGFEPADPIAEVGGLANRWFKPTHPTHQSGEYVIRTRDTLLRYAVFPGLWFKPTHPTLQCCYSSPRRIRTATEQVLNLLPLPIGLQDHTRIFITWKIQDPPPPRLNILFVLPKGFEPPTYSLGNCCSIQLSYKSMVILINFHDFNTTG